MRQKRICLSKDTKTGRKKPWLVRWWGEYDPATDNQRRYSQSFLKKFDAETFMHKKMQEFDEGLPRDEINLTLEKLWEKFEKTQKGRLKAGAFMHYNEACNRMKNYFGPDTCIKHIRTEHVEEFLSQLNYIAPKYQNLKKKLSDSTWNRILRCCRRIFNKALEWQYIRSNPFENIKQLKAKTQKWHKYTPDEFNDILAQITDIKDKTLFALIYGCGLRAAETLNLLWLGDNIDFTKNKINLYNRPDTKGIPPFSIKDYAQRSITMPNYVKVLLLRLKASSQSGSPFVFLTKDRWNDVLAKWKKFQSLGIEREWDSNKDIDACLLKRFKKYCKRADIKTYDKITVHGIRKSWACNLADMNTPTQTLMKLGGWSEIETCQKYYLQSTDANEQRAIEGLEKLVRIA